MLAAPPPTQTPYNNHTDLNKNASLNGKQFHSFFPPPDPNDKPILTIPTYKLSLLRYACTLQKFRKLIQAITSQF